MKSVETSSNQPELETTSALAEVAELKEALASCVQQMEKMQEEFAARSQHAQPNTTVQSNGPSTYRQPASGRMNQNFLRPRVPIGQISLSPSGWKSLG